MGTAKLQRAQHSFVHYFSLAPIYNQFESLNNQSKSLRLSIIGNNKTLVELDTYNKVISHLSTIIGNKLENIRSHSVRVKRGLINGLGTALKFITGNLDNQDEIRINKILKHLQYNQQNIHNQIAMQYSINHEIIKDFNVTIKDIQFNENTLKTKILEFKNVVNKNAEYQNAFSVAILYNELIVIYSSLLNVIEEIENSITFCKHNAVHPSIIKPNQLYLELEKISKYYPHQLPFEVSLDNILNFESILKVQCKIEPLVITYILTIPIDFAELYNLYYLQSIPTLIESKFVTILPDVKYFLKSKQQQVIIPLRDICTQSNTIYQCLNHQRINSDTVCERNILLHKNISNCRYTKLHIDDNHVELMPELNQYLGVFPKAEPVQEKCTNRNEIKPLHGIFLIQESQCTTYFRNAELTYQDKTYGSPEIMEMPNLKISHLQIDPLEINLKNLHLKDLPVNQLTPVVENEISYQFDIWTILLYGVLIPIGIYFLYQWGRQIFNFKNSTSAPTTDTPRSTNVNLPEEASF